MSVARYDVESRRRRIKKPQTQKDKKPPGGGTEGGGEAFFSEVDYRREEYLGVLEQDSSGSTLELIAAIQSRDLEDE